MISLLKNLENGEVTKLTMQPERGVFEVRGQLKGYEEGKQFITYVTNTDSEIERIDAMAADIKLINCLLKKQVVG